MLAFLRSLAVPAALTALCWVLAALWLARGAKTPDGTDLLIWFVALPVLVVGVWVAARVALRPRADSVAPAAAAPPAASPPGDTPELPPLAVLFAQVNSALGSDAGATLAGLRAQTACVAPDSALTGDDGLPLMTARVADLDVAAVRNWASRHPALVAEASDGALRSLALLDTVLDSTAEALPQHVHGKDAAASGGRLHVCVFAPDELAAAALARCREKLHGGADPAVRIDVLAPVRDESDRHYDALAVVSGFARTCTHAGAADTLVLIGCDSLIDESGAARAARLRPADTRAQSPARLGELASAMVLAPARAGLQPIATLHPAAHARRAAPAGAGGAVNARSAVEVLSACLTHAGLAADAPCGVVSDIDLRSPWVVEHALAMTEQLPHLDPVADHVAVAAALGVAGDDGGLGVLALAATWAYEAGAPVISTLMAGPTRRSAAVLGPCLIAAPTSLQPTT